MANNSWRKANDEENIKNHPLKNNLTKCREFSLRMVSTFSTCLVCIPRLRSTETKTRIRLQFPRNRRQALAMGWNKKNQGSFEYGFFLSQRFRLLHRDSRMYNHRFIIIPLRFLVGRKVTFFSRGAGFYENNVCALALVSTLQTVAGRGGGSFFIFFLLKSAFFPCLSVHSLEHSGDYSQNLVAFYKVAGWGY